MSKSLNQAFIKAYSKEQANLEKKRQQGSNTGLNADEFIVRFDTATCVVPSTHSNPVRKSNATTPTIKPQPAAIAKPSVSKRSLSPNSTRSIATERTIGLERRDVDESGSTAAANSGAETQAERLAASELRNEIAVRMSRAGAWDDQQIDAFIGGFPMISPYHQRTNHAPVGSQPAGDQGLRGPHYGRKETRHSIFAVSRDTAHTAAQSAISGAARNQPTGDDETDPLRVAPLDDNPFDDNLSASQPLRATKSQRPTAQRDEPSKPAGEIGSSADSVPDLKPLEFPALSGRGANAQSAYAAQLSRDARVQERGGNGEIFRLDRPTYSQHPEASAIEQLTDSGELSSEVLGLSSSGTNLDFDVLGSSRGNAADQAARQSSDIKSMPVSSARSAELAQDRKGFARQADTSAATARTKSLESDLRKAKVRIFNPVWEVDCFQWPDICLELLQQRAQAMELVARNLIEACQEGLQVLAVTSPHSGEGRTTVACCLAKLAGSRGLNVAIVDGDIENPTLSYQTNLDVDQDWKTAIFNQLPLEEVAVHSIDDQVTLVPLVAPIDHNEMSTDDNRIEFMLHELSESFDLVIVDMGHMDSSRSLVTSLGERGVISAVVAVVDYRSSTRQQVDDCLRRIRQTGVASIGLVENFAA